MLNSAKNKNSKKKIIDIRISRFKNIESKVVINRLKKILKMNIANRYEYTRLLIPLGDLLYTHIRSFESTKARCPSIMLFIAPPIAINIVVANILPKISPPILVINQEINPRSPTT
jgi:hypothetical protein